MEPLRGRVQRVQKVQRVQRVVVSPMGPLCGPGSKGSEGSACPWQAGSKGVVSPSAMSIKTALRDFPPDTVILSPGEESRYMPYLSQSVINTGRRAGLWIGAVKKCLIISSQPLFRFVYRFKKLQKMTVSCSPHCHLERGCMSIRKQRYLALLRL